MSLLLILQGFKRVSAKEVMVVNTPMGAYDYQEADEYQMYTYENTISCNGERKDG